MVDQGGGASAGRVRAWLSQAGNLLKSMPPAEAGKQFYEPPRLHSSATRIDGTAVTRPELQGHLRRAPCASRDGTSVMVDDNYIRESILEPQAKIVRVSSR